MKPKAKTIQERFGFKDEELATPKHDEIMLWLDANIETIVANLIPQKWTEHDLKSQAAQLRRAYSTWIDKATYKLGSLEAETMRNLKGDVDRCRSKGEQEAELRCMKRLDEYLISLGVPFPNPGPVPPTPACEVVRKQWEFTIMDRTYTVGFADFLAEVRKPRVHLYGADPEEKTFAPNWHIYVQPFKLLFEVKPTIRSLGELIRQINFYREYEREGRFYVVSPDDRFRSTLESQEIGFVKYSA